MNYSTDIFREETGRMKVFVTGSFFKGTGGVTEWHVMIIPEISEESFDMQLKAVHQACEQWQGKYLINNSVSVFRRYFLSDASNQEDFLREQLRGRETGSVSIIQQPPANGAKVALWMYGQEGESGGYYNHYWYSRVAEPVEDSLAQTRSLFEAYEDVLRLKKCSLKEDCIRTWLFVRDIDVNYTGVVKARKDFFREQGLTEQTHYIASTGIEGRTTHAHSCVALDAYAVSGLRREQIQYLKALTHLNPTWEYGVTFERGISILYGDRKQAYISGTASIDSKGEIVGKGNIGIQILRMLENVRALLLEGGYDFQDIAQMIVYLRDFADYQTIKNRLDHYFSEVPKVLLLAPVCRPGWLVEMECIAIRKEEFPDFPVFS